MSDETNEERSNLSAPTGGQGADNYEIADQFSLLSKLMDIHGENSFKSKGYSIAAFTIEKLSEQLADMSPAEIFKIKGIGESTGKKVIEIIETGSLQQLQDLIKKTPEGVLEMMNIKGLGPKKINTLWKEMKIDSIEELKKACEDNRLAETKGFGEKTQQKILDSIQFVAGNTGKYLYRQVESFAEVFQKKIEQKFKKYKIEITGEYRRQIEIISELEWVTTIPKDSLRNFVETEEVKVVEESDKVIVFNAENTMLLRFYLTTNEDFAARLFETTGSEEFIEEWKNFSENDDSFSSEEELFEAEGINYIPPFLRENGDIIRAAENEAFDDIIQTNDIKGLIHSHSNWSDGGHTVEEMSKALIDLGFEYLVISDHSKSAYYANGLSEQRIKEQHKYVDELNKKLKPFKIFKSIECDILGDGTLDYDNKILSTFDLVITSVHSNLEMDEEKAMKRLLGAITNPYTTILGHMTGRLLLKRKGFPVNYEMVIEACAGHNVAIEINANPRRLDMDWRWINYALEKDVMLSIDPDAHTIDEFQLIKYGVLVAQKGALPSRKNLSSYSLKEFEDYLQKTRKLKKIT